MRLVIFFLSPLQGIRVNGRRRRGSKEAMAETHHFWVVKGNEDGNTSVRSVPLFTLLTQPQTGAILQRSNEVSSNSHRPSTMDIDAHGIPGPRHRVK